MGNEEAWYIVKQSNGSCEILPATEVEVNQSGKQSTTSAERWGPFGSHSQAIARRVGLIRAGKCLPI